MIILSASKTVLDVLLSSIDERDFVISSFMLVIFPLLLVILSLPLSMLAIFFLFLLFFFLYLFQYTNLFIQTRFYCLVMNFAGCKVPCCLKRQKCSCKSNCQIG